jgi:glycosyltransferase involved in cell wall biosynthesis
MTHSLLLLSRYRRKGPSSRVRHYNFIPALEAAGFRVTVAPFFDDEYLDRFYSGEWRSPLLLLKAYGRRLRQILSARRYDLIWLEKEALPWLPATIERSFLGSRPAVVDFDDAWHLRYADHRSALVRAVLGRKLETIAAHANVVTAGSPALTDWAKSAQAPSVIEMPPTVDLDRYPVLPPPQGPFTIGWIGTPRSEHYLALIAEPLRRLQAAYGTRVRMIGSARDFSLPGVATEHVPWREDTEAIELAACHVGVMPLPDTPWDRGKCGYKAIQFMAAARPVVAAAVGASLSIIVPGQTGFLANSAEDWVSALSGLAADRERAQRLGLAARRSAEMKYSLQRNSARLVEIFLNALASRTASEYRSATSNPEHRGLRTTIDH